MRFALKGKAIFEARDLDDALEKLSEHFKMLADGQDSDLFASNTDIVLEVEEDAT